MKKIILSIVVALMPLLGISQNYALNFDGVDDHISLGQNFGFENTDQFTVEAWVNMSTQTGIQQIISKLDLTFRGWGFQNFLAEFIS